MWSSDLYELDNSLEKYVEKGLSIECIPQDSIKKINNILNKFKTDEITEEVLCTIYSNFEEENQIGFKWNKKLINNNCLEELKKETETNRFQKEILNIQHIIMKFLILEDRVNKEVPALLEINLIRTLKNEIVMQTFTDIEYEIYKVNMISPINWHKTEDINKSFSLEEYRPAFRYLFQEIYEYSYYLLNFIKDKKLLNKIKDPSFINIVINIQNERSITINPEFLEILNEYLSNEEIDYFLSELFYIVYELDEEMTYILNNIYLKN